MSDTNIVSCIKIPEGTPASGKYVCFTRDFRIFAYDELIRRKRVPPPKPPENICFLPDIFADLVSPKRFAKAVGVPCRITTPCVIYRLVDGKEVAEKEVDEEKCECTRDVEPPPNTCCLSAWDVEKELLEATLHLSIRTGIRVYRQAVFIGKKKVYAAPWGPDGRMFNMLKMLVRLGFISEEEELEIGLKHGAYDVSDVIASEMCGRVYNIAFNFYKVKDEPEPTYHALLVYWVPSDKSARRYALKLWDLYKDVTLRVLKHIEELERAIPYARDLVIPQAPYAEVPWRTSGLSPEEAVAFYVAELSKTRGLKVLHPADYYFAQVFEQIMDAFTKAHLKGKSEEDEDEEQA